MKSLFLTTLIIHVLSKLCSGQAILVNMENKTYETTKNITINGQVGYMVVPENRNNPSGRKIKLKYIHLKSISESPGSPLIYLEGGGDASTWQAEDPEELTFWLKALEVSDLIFLDQRGAGDDSLAYIWTGEFPSKFFISEQYANAHYKRMTEAGLFYYAEQGIDVKGYDLEEFAKDVNDLANALRFDIYSIYGFSFGSQIGMSTMKLYPERIDKAILAGSDAPNQAFNYPRYLDIQIDKLASMVAQDEKLSAKIPDFNGLVTAVMQQLRQNPVQITLKNPLTGNDVDVDIGPFGLALILRMESDDTDDIPALPRLIYSIAKEDYSMLTWFVQKRLVWALALPGNGINQQIASGTTVARWMQIEKEAEISPFGNVVNFPFAITRDNWVEHDIVLNTLEPMNTNIPTLFITGTLDYRTPVEQVEETMKGFSNAVHVQVENAGHAQAIWDMEINNEIIPAFLAGRKMKNRKVYYTDIKFLPLEGPAKGHPSIN